MMHRASQLLGACAFAALCGCAAMQEPRHDARAPAESQHPPVSITTPVVSAETPAPPADQKAAATPLPHAAPEPLAARTLELLREAEQFSGLPSDLQQRTLAEAELRHNTEQTPLTLVHYALLLSLSEPDRQDSADAAAGLRDLLDAPPGGADKDLDALAQLLLQVLDQREHLLAQNVELQRKLNQLKAIEQQLGDREGADAPQIAP